MSDEGFKFQVSIKTPSATLINVRAMDEEELQEGLDVLGRQLRGVGEVESILSAMTNIYAGFSPTEKVRLDAEAQAAAPAAQKPAQGRAAAPASNAGPTPSGQWVPDGGIPICEHGEYKYNTGQKNGNTWEAYFCPAPKGDPTQHSPVFKPRNWGGR